MIKMADEMDQLFIAIISNCTHRWRFPQFSEFICDHLEKYERNVRKEIVSRKKKNCAPLFHACKISKVHMVEYLISTCGADVEQRGCWYEEEGTPLWCAAARGQLPIIECLVRHGGQVNAISDSGTTPVLAACRSPSKLDNVKYLVEHGADIHRANDSGRTCLMEAAHNVELCEFLLKNGAHVDAMDIGNKTALQYAIQGKNIDTVKLLLDYKADPNQRSHDNDDALQTACLVRSTPIFDYLVEHGSYSPGRLANANELMGSRCFRDNQTAVKYWRKAIEIRNSNTVDGNPLAKTYSMPKRDCYRNASEFTTLDELDAIALDWDALKIQNLLIHERILGEHHEATFDALRRIGATYTNALEQSKFTTDSWRYCFDPWRRALEISAANDSILWDDVADVTEGLILALYSLHKRIPLEVADPNRVNEEQSRFADVVAIFKLLTSRLVTAQPPPKVRLLAMYSLEGRRYDKILKYITHLMDLLVKTARTSEAEDEVRALVRHLVNQNPKVTYTDDTLLHLSVSDHFQTASRHFSWDYDVLTFPDLEVPKLLLECEADVNARNINGKTPLRIASGSWNFSYQLVKLLLDHGAHLDTPDSLGKTPAHKISAQVDNTGDLVKYTTLRCLAAQAIVKYEIQYNDLPASLNQFLDLHRV